MVVSTLLKKDSCVSLEIANELLGQVRTSREIQAAARFAWRDYGRVHFTEVTLTAVSRLLAIGAAADAQAFATEAIREHDRIERGIA